MVISLLLGCRAASGLRRRGGSRSNFTSVKWHAVERVERLPGDALRIDGPVLVALGVTAGRALLCRSRDISLCEAGANIFEFFAVLGLNAKVVESRLRASR